MPLVPPLVYIVPSILIVEVRDQIPKLSDCPSKLLVMTTARIDTTIVMVEWAMSEVIRNLCSVKESPRLHPSTLLMILHKASADVKLESYDIPKGSNLVFRPKWLKEENIDIKGHDFRVLPFEVGWRVCPGTQLGINLHFRWALLDGVGPRNVGMEKNSGIVTFMHTPLLAIAVSRLLSHLYKHVLLKTPKD
ncbi:Cytochrome P450 98A3 [Ananas comosus]|uniref:Cytochrome P450 98A3 n=1 Tax=Ananas comosus TaxID=4615 RepID=A0A199V017_ANACO|nr:Cytochrome P450 98A3 [Ananas comosus]